MGDEVPSTIAAAPAVGRAWKPAIVTFLGGASVFLLMADQYQVRHGVLYGFVCLLLFLAGLLRWLGLLREDASGPAVELRTTAYYPLPGEPSWAAPRIAVPASLLVFVGLGLALGFARLPYALAAALALLIAPALRRPGLLVFVIASGLYLVLLGHFGLWDPWETHYGEVAREILSRDDWISLWWAQDHWFWSKPIGIFWSEALVWGASGLPFKPDGDFTHVEWVLRFPIFLYALAGLLAAYAAMKRAFSARTALLGALVLATMPYYALLTHQAITDMPCVGTMVAAVMLLLLAVHTDAEERVKSYRIGPLVISLQEIVLGFFLLICVPQVLYLASRNVTLVDGLFDWHKDEFLYGSGHNPNVPGNPGLHMERPYFEALVYQPLAQALVWALSTAAIVFVHRRERRARPLYMLAFYVLCGLSFMAKGAPGFGLPGLIALLYLLGCNRWSLLFTGQLRVAVGSLALLTCSLPWFIAMHLRHGPGFTDRLVIHDHINRLAAGVHGDTGSIQYFIQQFGYGTFPWIALAPLALGSWLLLPSPVETESAQRLRQRETMIVLGLWFGAAFTLYSAMITKFHHYVFPASPPAALLIGILLDRMLGRPLAESAARSRAVVLGCALLAPLPLVLGIGGLRGNLRGALPDGLDAAAQAVWVFQHGWPRGLCVALIVLGLGLLALAVVLARPSEDAAAGETPETGDTLLSAGLAAGAVLCAFVGRDLSWSTSQRPVGNERLIDLFIYNYERPFPPDFDYRPIFAGFAIVATLLVAGAALRVLRPVLTLSLTSLAVCFAVFFLDVYMVDLTPHWSQEGLVQRYYKERKSSREPLVAWQMNWKGENFYTGNRAAVFVDLNNKEVMDWVEKNKGVTGYFILEHSRLGRLKSMVSPRPVDQLTSERDNNKFTLVKVPM